MKNLVISMLLLFLTIGTHAQTKQKTEKVYFTCEMDCHACEQKLGEQLRFTKGVKDLKVDYASRTIFVEYKLDKTDKSKIIASIKDKEYQPIEISEQVYIKQLETGE